jgi:nitrous oxide reductase accessory protein NosL
MHHNVLVLLLYSVALVLVGCKKHETPPPVPKSQAQTDVCRMVTKEEIEGTGIVYQRDKEQRSFRCRLSRVAMFLYGGRVQQIL